MQVMHLSRASKYLLALVLLSGFNVQASFANGFTPYKVDMNRIDPDKPIRKSAILKNIRNKFPGRILSIKEDSSGGPDCHVVKSMGNDGELRIIEVACKKSGKSLS